MELVCILYHDVVRCGSFDSSGFLLPGADRYKLDREDFDRQLKAIASETRRKAVALADFGTELSEKQLVITFDDGGVSAQSVIAETLERFGWRGHFFIATDFIGTNRFLSRGQIRELR